MNSRSVTATGFPVRLDPLATGPFPEPEHNCQSLEWIRRCTLPKGTWFSLVGGGIAVRYPPQRLPGGLDYLLDWAEQPQSPHQWPLHLTQGLVDARP